MQPSRRVLEPAERTAEETLGLIMVLTFTGSLSVAQAGRDDIRAMLIGALGCNIAWGVIDGILYLMDVFAEKGRTHDLPRRPGRSATRRTLADRRTLPPVIASALEPGGAGTRAPAAASVPDRRLRARLDREDWRGAFGVYAARSIV